MKNKKGQFYLLSAIIIIAILIGFVTISNYSNRKTTIRIYDLEEELGIESQNIMDYGTYKEYDIDSLLNQFVESYADYMGEGKNLYFLFGDSEEITVKAYQEISEKVSVGGEELIITSERGARTYNPVGNIVIVSVDDVEYQFELTEGENFYFIISQEIEGEKYVITN
ncbi:MAG: hypothetical protein PHU63_03870 [Candidatus ainarchaeum sp.]|nr:hypothetical protein [Candidatus ainarchaeum sp.]